MRHYVAVPTIPLNDNSSINNKELAEQSAGVKSLWNDVISETVLRMLELQKIEEDILRKDPLSIISVNSTARKELKRKFGDKFLEKSNSKKEVSRKSSPDQNKSNVEEQKYFKLLSSHHSTNSESLHKEIEKINERDRANATGDKCTKCQSNWTIRSDHSSYGFTKAEVWGNKDNTDIVLIKCKECDHVEAEKSY